MKFFKIFALTKNQLILILVSYLNIQCVKTLNSNKSFNIIDEYCVNQWPDLLTCASDQELDIKAIFDELGDSQQTPPNFYQKLKWTAPLVNGEIPENAFGTLTGFQVKLRNQFHFVMKTENITAHTVSINGQKSLPVSTHSSYVLK